MAKSKSSLKFSVEDLLVDFPPQVRELVQVLRRLILEVVPNASETAQPSWRSLNYRHPESGYFCGIFPQQDMVRLAFEFGALLPDPENLLTGEGRQVRYLDLQDKEAIPVERLKEFLLAALALPSQREVKLALIRSGAKPRFKN